MRFIKHISLLFIVTCLSFNTLESQVYNPNTTTVRNAGNTKVLIHTVKMGETAYSIATAHNTTVESIYKLNPGSEKGINVGQELKMPSLATVSNTSTTNTYTHTIQPQETLFSVSQLYAITVSELKKANPGLNEENFSIGKEIALPNFALVPQAMRKAKETPVYSLYAHRVEKHDTLYSIGKKYDCSVDDILKANPSIKSTGLKEGFTIHIPRAGVFEQQGNQQVAKLASGAHPTYFLPEDGVVRIALLLPFIEGSKSVSQEKITEYYEGFLLAVQKMKERGLNAEIYTFDIGNDGNTKRLEAILGTNELNSLNLIIGGVSDKQVQLISRFSQRTGVKYVVPFSNKNTGVENNPFIFQVANSHTNLFPKIARSFVQMFRDYNIIFLSESDSDKDKMSLIKELQKELGAGGIAFRTAPTSASITGDLGTVLDTSKKNIVVPTSSSKATLKAVIEALEALKRNKTHDISLFGYPDWQTYINEIKDLHKINTYIYGMFYLNSNDTSTQLFADKYRKWYNKSLVISYPKFAHMGYDTGLVFLTALQDLGHDFSPKLSTLNCPTLQSALYFQQMNAKSGFINTGVYIVNLKPDDTVEKIEISRR